MDQKQQAETFRQMHLDEDILVLPGVWDVLSARTAVACGFGAVALASAPVSWSLGKRDGEQVSREQVCRLAEKITNAVGVPVSVDIEKGYGQTPDDVGETGAMMLAAGVAGFNIEDSLKRGELREIEDMQARIAALRSACDRAGVNAVINARADAFLLGMKGDDVYQDVIRRAQSWRAAGADCIFVPGVDDAGMIARLNRDIEGPVNILVMHPDMPGPGQLQAMGIARLSTGPRLLQAMMGQLESALLSLHRGENCHFMDGAMAFARVQDLL